MPEDLTEAAPPPLNGTGICRPDPPGAGLPRTWCAVEPWPGSPSDPILPQMSVTVIPIHLNDVKSEIPPPETQVSAVLTLKGGPLSPPK